MVAAPPEEKDDDEPRYTAWLDLPISTREPMTAKDANEARKALTLSAFSRGECSRQQALCGCGSGLGPSAE